MARNKNQTKSTKTPKIKKNFKKGNVSKLSKKKKLIKKLINEENVGDKIETNNGSVLELMTTYPELSQTFEYILYSNKYKHTLTDVFNIIKMLMSKLEELQKNDVDLKNIFETINLNYKIKGLVQSTAINLSHVVEQLNVNESTFLNFARTFTPLKIINDSESVTENAIPSFASSSIVPEESFVSSSPSCSYNYQSPPEEDIKRENITVNNQNNSNIFSRNTIVLSSDDEYEESNLSGDYRENPTTSRPIKNDEELESYVIGADIKDILSDLDNSNSNVNFLTISNQETTLPKVANLKTVQKTKKSKPKVSEEVVSEARRLDLQLRKRLNDRKSEMLNLIKELNLQPNEIVLEFDAVKKRPSVTIHKELAKVLKRHQVEGIRFIWNTVFETIDRTNSTDGTGCILAHRMGIGKTLQVITLMYTILCQIQLNIKTFLIICPPGLIYNWMDEIYKWLKDIDNGEIIKVYDLPKTNKLYNITNIATWQNNGGILILSYENFKSLVNCKQTDLQEAFSHTLINPGPDVVILDEGHYIKNTNTILLKSLSQIRTKRRIVLTGTPIQNSLKEYFTMVDFVKPNILGNFGEFSTIFIKPIDSGQFIDSSDESVKIMKQRTFILHKLLQNTVHRIDDRNLKPLFTDKIEYTIEVNMTAFQCELYEKFLNYSKTSNDSSSNVFLRLHVLTLITLHPLTLYRLIRYKNGKQSEFGTASFDDKFVKDLTWIADYGEDPRFFEAEQSNKITYLLNTIDECQKRNEKILCFLKSPLALDAIEYFLQKEKNWIFGEDYLRMDGKTPLPVRNQMCEAFNNSESRAKLFILSMGTGILGYNMVGANRVLLLSTSWNPSSDLQAIYRCLRFGQKKTVYVNRLLAKGTVEPKAYYRQVSKLGMASSVVDLQLVNRKVSYDQTSDLFAFDSSKHRFILAKATKDPVLNEIIHRNIEFISDLKEHDLMLAESMEDQLSVEERRAVWLSFKNKELGIKSLIKPISLHKLMNSEQHNKTHVMHEEPEIDQKYSIPSNSLQVEEEQMSTPNTNQNQSSRLFRYFNNPKPIASPTFSRTHTKFTDTAEKSTTQDNDSYDKRNRWKNDEPSIINQFRHFQNKTFSHHKRYPGKYNHPNSFDRTSSRAPSRMSQYQNQQSGRYGSSNPTSYPNHITPTDKNIQNRSGMFQ